MVQSDDIFDFENEKYKEEFMRRKRLSMKVAAAILAAADSQRYIPNYPSPALATPSEKSILIIHTCPENDCKTFACEYRRLP